VGSIPTGGSDVPPGQAPLCTIFLLVVRQVMGHSPPELDVDRNKFNDAVRRQLRND
jgi:hypothetical protein